MSRGALRAAQDLYQRGSLKAEPPIAERGEHAQFEQEAQEQVALLQQDQHGRVPSGKAERFARI